MKPHASLLAGARGLLSSLLDLFALEARRAGLALVLMLACGAVGAVLVVAAWLGLMSALALWAVTAGLSWQAAIAAASFANLGGAALLFWGCAKASRGLLFPATRRQLHPARLEVA